MRQEILSAIAQIEAQFSFKFVPAAQAKPKSVPGAIQKYAKSCTPSQVVAIMDTTLFSSGKEGFLFTETHFYNSFAAKTPVQLDNVTGVKLAGKDHVEFTYKGGKKETLFTSIYAPYIHDIFDAILKQTRKRPKAQKKAEEPKAAAPKADSLEAAVAQMLAGQKSKKETPAPEAQSPAQLVETGKRELDAKHYDAAREAFRKAAEQGSAEGAYRLGRMYHDAQGMEKDDVQAVEWYRKAADQGYALAQNALGRMYDKGWGVTKNYSDAFHWYRKAAEQGLAVAQFNVGNMYYHGDGVPGDYSMAREWYEKAAAQGNAKAMYGLGQIYENGKGVKEDKAEAVKWYRMAAEKGHEKAKEALERLEKKDQAPEQGDASSLFSLQEAIARQLAKQGAVSTPPEEVKEPETPEEPEPEKTPAGKTPTVDPQAEKLLSEGLKEYRTGNYGAASRAFQKAANLDHPYAWFNLGVIYEKGRGVSRNLSTAFRWYLKAAEANIAEAQYNVGQMYYLGEGTDADQDKAFEWYLKAAEAGIAEAQAMVGAIYQGHKDLEQARMWLQKAADQGLEAAKGALEKL